MCSVLPGCCYFQLFSGQRKHVNILKITFISMSFIHIKNHEFISLAPIHIQHFWVYLSFPLFIIIPLSSQWEIWLLLFLMYLLVFSVPFMQSVSHAAGLPLIPAQASRMDFRLQRKEKGGGGKGDSCFETWCYILSCLFDLTMWGYIWSIPHTCICKYLILFNKYFLFYMYNTLFAHFYIDGHLTDFYIFTLTNSGALNVYMYMRIL